MKGEFPKGEPFAKRLRRLRDEQGLNRAKLAGECGCTEAAIRDLETGVVDYPSLPLGLRFAKSMHVDPNYLARGDAVSVTARITENAERITWAITEILVRLRTLEDQARARRRDRKEVIRA